MNKKTVSKRPARKRGVAKTTATSKKVGFVYYFGDGKADGSGSMKPLLGGKGANLHEMTRIGLRQLQPVSDPRCETGRCASRANRSLAT